MWKLKQSAKEMDFGRVSRKAIEIIGDNKVSKIKSYGRNVDYVTLEDGSLVYNDPFKNYGVVKTDSNPGVIDIKYAENSGGYLFTETEFDLLFEICNETLIDVSKGIEVTVLFKTESSILVRDVDGVEYILPSDTTNLVGISDIKKKVLESINEISPEKLVKLYKDIKK